MLGGVIGPDCRGEVKVLLYIQGAESVTLALGDRVAQLVLERCSKAGAECRGKGAKEDSKAEDSKAKEKEEHTS